MATEWFCIEKCGGKDACKHRHEADGSCVYEYDASRYSADMRWKGDGDPPRRWNAGGTIVYRTFADYCD